MSLVLKWTDRPPITSYQKPIITIGLSCTVSEITGEFQAKFTNLPHPRVFIAPADGLPPVIL